MFLQYSYHIYVRLADVASIELEQGPPMIKRDGVQRRVVIQSNVENRDMGSLVVELDQRIQKEIDLPPGYTVVFGGQFKNQQRAQAKLMVVVPLSLLMIFLLLYFMFNSVGQAICNGAESRFRPVLMTAMIAGLGLVPLLLSNGIGSEINVLSQPLLLVVWFHRRC